MVSTKVGHIRHETHDKHDIKRAKLANMTTCLQKQQTSERQDSQPCSGSTVSRLAG